ncbi:MAG: PIN domain-containing protein, partial [Hyphomicrobiales bacterium]
MLHLAVPWPKTMSESVLGVDTNILVRFFADDDDLQSAQAKQFIADNQPVYVSMLVLSEAFNVLTKVRKFPMSAVHNGYRMLLRSPGIVVEDPQIVAQALEDGEGATCGFTDALIALQNRAFGCSTTATFDHRAARLE